MYVGQREFNRHTYFFPRFLLTGTFNSLNYKLLARNFQLLTEAEIPRVIKKFYPANKTTNSESCKAPPFKYKCEISTIYRIQCHSEVSFGENDIVTKDTYQDCFIILSKYHIYVSILQTLRVADKVDPVCCVLHYGVNSCLESLHLLPHGLQTGTPVEQVDNRHICSRMGLQEREEDGFTSSAGCTGLVGRHCV